MSEKSDLHERRLQAVDASQLTPLVRKALDSQTATVVNWNYQPVSGGVSGGMLDTYIYRFSGAGEDQGRSLSWSLIVKILYPREDEKPADPKYWKREAEFYRSGLLDNLSSDFRAPRCFGVEEFPDGVCWIWQEELQDVLGKSWPLEHYRTVAHHVGQFSGAYAAKHALPTYPWMSSGWFRKVAFRSAPNLPNILKGLNTPLLKGAFPNNAEDQYSQLWSQRELFLDTLDSLPQTLCHLDIFRRNLIASHGVNDRDQTVAIDWAYVGKAALGADAALFVMVGLLMCEVAPHESKPLDEMVFAAYLEGLSQAGWQGKPETVRLGYTATVAAKYFEIVNVAIFLLDEANYKIMEQVTGHSLQDNVECAAEIFRFTMRMADEARDLMKRMA